jgi:hypothetical protein
MANTYQSTPFLHGIVRLVSMGRFLAVLAFVGFLLILISAPADLSPDATGIQSAPHKTTEDWRGNSGSIRPYDG